MSSSLFASQQALLCSHLNPFNWFLTTVATLSIVIPLVKQYLLLNHSAKFFDPLLALQDPQQSAMFSGPLILMSLIICSQVGLVFCVLNDIRQ